MAKLGINLKDGDGNFLYPRTFVEMIVRHSSNESLATILGNLSKDVVQAKADVDTFLSDFSLSKEVRTALIELRDYLESDDGKITEQLLSTINDLKDNAVKCPDYNSGEYIGTLTHGGTVLYPFTRDDLVFINSIPDYASLDSLLPRVLTRDAQTLSLEDKLQARQNIDAAGVSATYGDSYATISYNGNAIFPETKGSQVKLSIGGNAEDAIKANGGNIEKERVRAIAREDEIAETLAETKEKVDTFLADADTSEQAIDKLKELQEYIKNDETSASQMLGDIAQNKNDIADNAEAIEKEATRAKQTEMYLESQKANKYGYYEGLSVGVSDNLSGRGEATESEFSFRPSGGENKSIPEDGTARINSIKGNSVVWNQLAIQPEDNIGKVGETKNLVFNTQFLPKNNHVYLCTVYQAETLTSCERNTFSITYHSDSGVKSKYENASTNYKLNKGLRGWFFTLNDVTDMGYIGLWIYSPNIDVAYENFQLHDLTLMFGSGNEPATVEEFEALYGNMPNEYNEGTIIDNHTSAIKSVGANVWDEEWVVGLIESNGKPIENKNGKRTKNFIKVISGQSYKVAFKGNKITSTHAFLYMRDKTFISIAYNLETGKSLVIPSDCEFVKITFGDNTHPFTGIPEVSFHLVHTGYLNGKYFPYESQTRQLPTVEGGLKRAGTAYDEIRYNKGKDKWEHVQRIGSVDLGELEWIKCAQIAPDASVNSFQSDSINGLIRNMYGGDLLCTKYATHKDPYQILIGDVINKIASSEMGFIFVNDTNYTDVSAFKTAMQGVILYYELAEPVVTELDVDISPDYKVWDYGTEEAISEVLSTPVRINANYGFNAVGQITDNTELIKELLARVAVLEAQVAQANSTNVEPIEPIVE